MSRIPFFEKEDLNVFFSEFSEDCLITSLNTVIPCLYNERFGFISSLNNDVNGLTITIHLKNSDISFYNIKKTVNLKIRNTDFIVREIRKDGDGISEIELEKVK